MTIEKFDLIEYKVEYFKTFIDDKDAKDRMTNYEIDIYSGALECAIEAYLNVKEIKA